MDLHLDEIHETIQMVHAENLDIRTVTLGISLADCAVGHPEETTEKVTAKIRHYATNLVKTAQQVSKEYGIPIINKRIALTPLSQIIGGFTKGDVIDLAKAIDQTAESLEIDFVGGYSALLHKRMTKNDELWLEALPEVLASTNRLCGSASIGSTRAGINMDAIVVISDKILELAELTRHQQSLGCAKFVVFCNPVEDNPFMAGAFHGSGEGEASISVGVSGPGVVLNALKKYPEASLDEVSDIIKKMAFKITRAGELIGRQVAKDLGIPFNIIDLSLAPTNAQGDSVAEILEEIGLESVGTHGTIAALALLNDAVKKGGSLASSHVGGLSGAFIPVSEDEGMIRGLEKGSLNLEKLEGMTAVCSVGLDMIALSGDTSSASIAGLIADEAAIGMINKKTTAVRVIPVLDAKPGEMIDFGGLLGRAPVIQLSTFSSDKFVKRGGRIPSPIQALTN